MIDAECLNKDRRLCPSELMTAFHLELNLVLGVEVYRLTLEEIEDYHDVLVGLVGLAEFPDTVSHSLRRC